MRQPVISSILGLLACTAVASSTPVPRHHTGHAMPIPVPAQHQSHRVVRPVAHPAPHAASYYQMQRPVHAGGHSTPVRSNHGQSYNRPQPHHGHHPK